MIEALKKSNDSNEASQQKSGYRQYQHQTFNFHNTVGLVFMSIFAFVLLVALLRQQARCRKLEVQLTKQQ